MSPTQANILFSITSNKVSQSQFFVLVGWLVMLQYSVQVPLKSSHISDRGSETTSNIILNASRS